jgi:hypothetical protein
MADDESQDSSGPSLEPPKLFGRRRTDSRETPTTPETSAPSDASGSSNTAASSDTAAPSQGDTRVFQDAELADFATFADAGVDSAHDPQADGVAATHPPQSWKPRRAKTARGPLVIPGHIGAPIAGLLTGVALLGFMSLGFRGCETLTGTESCGKGPGLIALIVVFAAAVLFGKLLLTLMKLPEPGMTSFLAVGITSLIAVLMAASFAGSWYLTTVQLGDDD